MDSCRNCIWIPLLDRVCPDIWNWKKHHTELVLLKADNLKRCLRLMKIFAIITIIIIDLISSYCYVFSSATFASVGWKCEKSHSCSKRLQEISLPLPFPLLCRLIIWHSSASLCRSHNFGEGGGMTTRMPHQSQCWVSKRLKKSSNQMSSIGKGSYSNFNVLFLWQSARRAQNATTWLHSCDSSCNKPRK